MHWIGCRQPNDPLFWTWFIPNPRPRRPDFNLSRSSMMRVRHVAPFPQVEEEQDGKILKSKG